MPRCEGCLAMPSQRIFRLVVAGLYCEVIQAISTDSVCSPSG